MRCKRLNNKSLGLGFAQSQENAAKKRQALQARLIRRANPEASTVLRPLETGSP